jgi:uncharacterized membrane protein
MKHLLIMLVCAGGLAVAGCGGDSDGESEEGAGFVEDPEAEACKASDAPTYDNFAQDFVSTNCLGCHSSTKMGAARLDAPADLNFDTVEELRDNAPAVYTQVVVDKTMPEVLHPSDADREKLGVWLSCGAP